MKVEIELNIPDGYEFVRYGKMRQGEIGIVPGVLHLHLQHNAGMYKNDYFIIKKKVKLTKKTRRYLYEDLYTYEEAVGLMSMAEAALYLNIEFVKGDKLHFINRKFIKWLEDDWYEYEI